MYRDATWPFKKLESRTLTLAQQKKCGISRYDGNRLMNSSILSWNGYPKELATNSKQISIGHSLPSKYPIGRSVALRYHELPVLQMMLESAEKRQKVQRPKQLQVDILICMLMLVKIQHSFHTFFLPDPGPPKLNVPKSPIPKSPVVHERSHHDHHHGRLSFRDFIDLLKDKDPYKRHPLPIHIMYVVLFNLL